MNTELPEVNGQVTSTEVMVKLENQLDENRVYVLKTEDNIGNGLSDRAGNELKIACNFRAKRSYRLFSETGTHDVYDTLWGNGGMVPGNLFFIPLFHHSIIPGWNMQNGWVEISYYQQFVQITIHFIIEMIMKGGGEAPRKII